MAHKSTCVKIAACGRKFHLGSLYSFEDDEIIEDILLWDPDEVENLGTTKKVSSNDAQVKSYVVSSPDTEDNFEWLSNLELDDHTTMSLLTGLLSSSSSRRGAWKYVTELTKEPAASEQEAHRAEAVVHCRYTKREESILERLSELEIICTTKDLKKRNATHVVVAVTYGLEAMCSFSCPMQHQWRNLLRDEQNTGNLEAFDMVKRISDRFCGHLQNNKDDVSLADLGLYSNEASSDENEYYGDCAGSYDADQLVLPKEFRCSLYTDLNASSRLSKRMSSLSVQDAPAVSTAQQILNHYKACRKVVEPSDRSKFVPLQVLLYPVRKLELTEGRIPRMLRKKRLDIRGDLVLVCQTMLGQLQRIDHEANSSLERLQSAAYPVPPRLLKRLNRFRELMTGFGKCLHRHLRRWTIRVRAGSQSDLDAMSDWMNKLRTESPFDVDRLRLWFQVHEQQIAAVDILANLPDVQLVTKVTELLNHQNPDQLVVAQHLPSLDSNDGELDDVLGDMKHFVDKFDVAQEDTEHDGESESVPIPSSKLLTIDRHYSADYIDRILDDAQRFSDWATLNERLGVVTDVTYAICIDERPLDPENATIQLHEYDYRAREIVSTKIDIPLAPEEINVAKNRRGVVELAWENGDETFFDANEYLFEFRTSSEQRWISTHYSKNRITINDLQPEKQYEFRVALLTLVGVSHFSPSRHLDRIDPVCNPPTNLTMMNTTDSSVTVGWQHRFDHHNSDGVTLSHFDVECRPVDIDDDVELILRKAEGNELILEPLAPNTTYRIQVRAVCKDQKGTNYYSTACQPIECRTERTVRTAEVVRRQSLKSLDRCCIDVYTLMLKKEKEGRYFFGERNIQSLVGQGRQRTVLVVGATGSGKTTLINTMVNYIMGVEWEDGFRFKLINEPQTKTQAHSQTESVTVYDLYRVKGGRLGYSLTVVDTPGFGDTRGIQQDEMIVREIQTYLQDRDGIGRLEAVCLVVQSGETRLTTTQKYIFGKILELFGQDIKDSIFLMVTFADNDCSGVLNIIQKAIPSVTIDHSTGLPVHYKFNNSVFFPTSKETLLGGCDRDIFNGAFAEFERFFEKLGSMESKSLVQTREVLAKRRQVEVLVEGYQLKTDKKMTRIGELEKFKTKLAQAQEQATQNPNVGVDIELDQIDKIDINDQLATNCRKCKMTCHFPCAGSKEGRTCSTIGSEGVCRICMCQWIDHSMQNFKYELVSRTITLSAREMQERYNNIEREIQAIEDDLSSLIEITSSHFQRLEQIALQPHSRATLEYIDMLIKNERANWNYQPNSNQRIATLIKLRDACKLKDEIKNRDKSKPSQ